MKVKTKTAERTGEFRLNMRERERDRKKKGRSGEIPRVPPMG